MCKEERIVKDNYIIEISETEFCDECGKPVRYLISNFGNTQKRFRQMCECEKERINQEEIRKKEEEAQRMIRNAKKDCFNYENMWNWNFDNDNGLNSKFYFAKKYVADWDDASKERKGLMLIGDVGTGKTYMACSIANALIEKGCKVKFTNFIEITNDVFSVSDKNEYIRSFNKYDLLIIDDVGVERNSEYSLENIFMIINERFNSNKPIIITTNKELDKKECDNDIYHRRINDRFRAMCIPIGMPNTNIREIIKDESNAAVVMSLAEGGDYGGD